MKWAVEEIKKLYDIFPKVLNCVSNHDFRAAKMAFRFGIPSMFLRSIKEWMHAPDGWHWKEYWEFSDSKVRAFHGEPFTGNNAHTAAKKHMQSVVFGHTHQASVTYSRTPNGQQIFSANFGCLIDDKEDPKTGKIPYCFNYASNTTTKPIIGTGVILDNGRRAEFIPLE